MFSDRMKTIVRGGWLSIAVGAYGAFVLTLIVLTIRFADK